MHFIWPVYHSLSCLHVFNLPLKSHEQRNEQRAQSCHQSLSLFGHVYCQRSSYASSRKHKIKTNGARNKCLTKQRRGLNRCLNHFVLTQHDSPNEFRLHKLWTTNMQHLPQTVPLVTLTKYLHILCSCQECCVYSYIYANIFAFHEVF